jgi:hypothetical protein
MKTGGDISSEVRIWPIPGIATSLRIMRVSPKSCKVAQFAQCECIHETKCTRREFVILWGKRPVHRDAVSV